MSNLTTKQRKAIAALLSEPTTEAAAFSAGISSKTIRRWLAGDPDFAQALAEAEESAISDAARVMGAGALEAVNTLRDLLEDPDPDRRHKAAAAYLAHLPKVRILGSLEAKITHLMRLKNGS